MFLWFVFEIMKIVLYGDEEFECIKVILNVRFL